MKVVNINQIKKAIDTLASNGKREAQQSKRKLAKASKLMHRAASMVEDALSLPPRKPAVAVNIRGEQRKPGRKRKAA